MRVDKEMTAALSPAIEKMVEAIVPQVARGINIDLLAMLATIAGAIAMDEKTSFDTLKEFERYRKELRKRKQ